MLIEKNLAFRTLCYLANLCNSTVIGIYGDIIQVSHGFDGCQILEYIADITAATFFGPCQYADPCQFFSLEYAGYMRRVGDQLPSFYRLCFVLLPGI